MCELLGVSARQPIEVQGYLQQFYSHSVKHPHGWGLLRQGADGKWEHWKAPECALKSKLLPDLICTTPAQRTMMGHIRLATVGSVKPENCHPYLGTDQSGRTWALMHNGTIYSSRHLTKYLNTQIGDTDSERVFLYLLEKLNLAIEENGGAPLDGQRRFQVVESVVQELSRRNKLNLLLFDGEFLYVHKNMRQTLYYCQTGQGLVFSTRPLDNAHWQPFPLTQLYAFREGEPVYAGEKHGAVFVPTLEYISAMAALNI